jgi:hypothetical protein
MNDMRCVTGRVATGLTALALLAACDNEPLQIVDTLGLDEVDALAEVLLDLTLAGNREVTTPEGASPPAAPTPFGATLQFQTPCPIGGWVDVVGNVSGTVDPEAGTGSLALDLVQTHEACRAVHLASGREFRLDGAPDLTVAYGISWTGGDFEAGGGYQGALDWSTDGRSGRCEVAVTFDAAGIVEEGATSASLSGTICGRTVSVSGLR